MYGWKDCNNAAYFYDRSVETGSRGLYAKPNPRLIPKLQTSIGILLIGSSNP